MFASVGREATDYITAVVQGRRHHEDVGERACGVVLRTVGSGTMSASAKRKFRVSNVAALPFAQAA